MSDWMPPEGMRVMDVSGLFHRLRARELRLIEKRLRKKASRKVQNNPLFHPIEFKKDLKNDVLHLFTDCSLGEYGLGVGFVVANHNGIVCYGGRRHFSGSTSFRGEVTAIRLGLSTLIEYNKVYGYSNLEVHTDSTQALEYIVKINNNYTDSGVLPKKQLAQAICLMENLTFKHIKGHVSVRASTAYHRLNDIADRLSRIYRVHGEITSDVESTLGLSGLKSSVGCG